MVTKTMEEWDMMTPEDRTAHLASEEKIVFGHDFRKRDGAPLEQGIGAPGRESANHFQAIRKYESEEAYWDAVVGLWKRDSDHAKKLGLPRPEARPKKAG